MPVNTDGHTIVGGYVIGDELDIGDIGVDGATQVETTLNPDDNLYTVRFYGRDGELIEERQMPVDWSETEITDAPEENTTEQASAPSINDIWATELPELGARIPYMALDGNGLNYYDEDGELLWRADNLGMYTTQSTSSAVYPVRNFRLNIDDFPATYDEDTRLADDDYARYLDATRESAEDFLRMVHGTRTELRDDFIRMRRRHLDEIFLKGEWKTPEEEEQPDIQEERGGALDEFLEKFTPQKTTPERSDEQE